MKKAIFIAALLLSPYAAFAQSVTPEGARVSAVKQALREGAAGLKKKHGQALAELKIKQRREILELREKLSGVSKEEELSRVSSRQKEHFQALEDLKKSQREELRLFFKNRAGKSAK